MATTDDDSSRPGPAALGSGTSHRATGTGSSAAGSGGADRSAETPPAAGAERAAAPRRTRPRTASTRPTDRYGLVLSTHDDAAAAFRHGIDTVLRCDTDGRGCLERAVLEDPGSPSVRPPSRSSSSTAGSRCVRSGGCVPPRCWRPGRTSATASAVRWERSRPSWAGHQAGAGAADRPPGRHPLDAFALSVAVPTVAFSGVTESCAEAWPLVAGCAPQYGDDWWFTSLLSFVREEQSDYDGAFDLASRALELEPRSGHAVHARTHVHYESGDHTEGLRWLSGWIADRPAEAVLAGHVNWHAALHELCLGDVDAVRSRFDARLRPPALPGLRAVVDGGSLLFRAAVRGEWTGDVPVAELIDAAGDALREPCSVFVGLHAALVLTLADDQAGLAALAARCHALGGTWSASLLPVVEGLAAFGTARWDTAAERLADALPQLPALGGSLAQREVVEETLLRALLEAGRLEQARALVRHRHHADRVLHWVPGAVADLATAPGDGVGLPGRTSPT